jgi:hypothetical protein
VPGEAALNKPETLDVRVGAIKHPALAFTLTAKKAKSKMSIFLMERRG